MLRVLNILDKKPEITRVLSGAVGRKGICFLLKKSSHVTLTNRSENSQRQPNFSYRSVQGPGQWNTFLGIMKSVLLSILVSKLCVLGRMCRLFSKRKVKAINYPAFLLQGHWDEVVMEWSSFKSFSRTILEPGVCCQTLDQTIFRSEIAKTLQVSCSWHSCRSDYTTRDEAKYRQTEQCFQIKLRHKDMRRKETSYGSFWVM